MISGKPMRADFRFRRAALACAVLVACGLGTPGVQAQALDVATLMQRLAQHPSGRATFVETKHLRMLDAPVVLLSPAAASFDQYSGFEARGEHFRTLVQSLEKAA